MQILRFAAVMAIASFGAVFVLPTCALADYRCQELEALHAKYEGVRLTADQKKLKRVLVAWYYDHCQGRMAQRR